MLSLSREETDGLTAWMCVQRITARKLSTGHEGAVSVYVNPHTWELVARALEAGSRPWRCESRGGRGVIVTYAMGREVHVIPDDNTGNDKYLA